MGRGIDVTTTVDIQPGRPIDREFPPLIFNLEIKLVAGRFKSSFDVLLKLHQVRGLARARTRRINAFTEIAG